MRASLGPDQFRRGAAPVVGLGLALLLAGCGGGGSSEEDLSRDGYIAKADAICAQFNTASAGREAQFNQALKSSDLESAAQDFEDQATESTAMLDQLAAEKPPEADQTTIDQLIAVGRQRVAAAQDAADAIASGDKDAMITAGKQGALLAGKFDQMADSFGFKDCGSAGTEVSGVTGATGATGATN
ncbi:MAG: hypothetical protein J0H98_10865 [Solirubrobacterales bacterium]|nr:hypothetical protein [Solirubrobacterales bacterium]